MIFQLILILVIISLCGLALPFDDKERTYPIYVILCIIILIFATFKDGSKLLDYSNYEYLFNEQPLLLEPSFQLIVYIVKKILSSEIFYFFFIYSFLAIVLKYLAIYKLSNILIFSLLIWLSDLFILQELTQIRAAIATGFLLISIIQIMNRNLKLFLIFAFLGTLFHYSAIIIFPLWFLNPHKFEFKYWIVLFCVTYILAILKFNPLSLIGLIPFGGISTKYELYSNYQSSGDFTANIFSLLFIGKSIITITLALRINLIAKYNKYAIIIIKIMFVSLISLLILSQNQAFALRVSEFYGIVSIILFPMIIYIIKQKYIGKLAVITLAFIMFYIRVFTFELIKP